jgi:hypothetical protein
LLFGALVLKMQRGDVSCAKQARVLSRNEIREIAVDSDSDEDKHYASQSQRMKRSHAHLRDGVPFHGFLVQVIPPAALKMRMLLAMWQCNSHRHCPLNPEGV